jgi:hypothetical protein
MEAESIAFPKPNSTGLIDQAHKASQMTKTGYIICNRFRTNLINMITPFFFFKRDVKIKLIRYFTPGNRGFLRLFYEISLEDVKAVEFIFSGKKP